MTKEIRIRRDGKEITIKIEKEYDGIYVDKELLEYLSKLSGREVEALDEGKSKIFKIVLEKDIQNEEIHSMYDDKRQKWMSSQPIMYEKCSENDDVINCMDKQMPPLYGILLVKTEDIIPEVAETPVAETPVAETPVAETQPIVARGGTRRRRKGKRKSRNNRKKTNRRR